MSEGILAQTILIADDDESCLKVLSDILSGAGYHVHSVMNGEAALSSVRLQSPDLILLDIRMPEMGGFEICRHLKASEQSRDIPVIFVSAVHDLSDKTSGFRLGAVDYITKPFKAPEVLARVKTHLTIRTTQMRLVDANRQLHNAHGELERLNAELEERVRTRTMELEDANDALRESETRFRSLFENAAFGIVICRLIRDGDGNVVDFEHVQVNSATQKHTGFSPERLLGSRALEIASPEELAHPMELYCRVVETGQADNYVQYFPVYDRTLELGVSHLKDDFFALTFVDISERVQAEEEIRTLNTTLERRVAERTVQLEAINCELKDFAYIVSHDLKAPLRGVSQLSKWILTDYADCLDEKGKEMLDLLGGRVRRMTDLINGILEYSRIGRLHVEGTSIDLRDIVRDVIAFLSPPEHIQVSLDSDLPVILGAPTRMTQLFQNLIGNAIQYHDKAQAVVRIRCEDMGELWKFSVSDNGPGIEKKDYERIFKIFQTSRCAGRESSGLGLTVVKKIVEFYGGRIWLDSEVGLGTTFFFTFPKGEAVNVSKKTHG